MTRCSDGSAGCSHPRAPRQGAAQAQRLFMYGPDFRAGEGRRGARRLVTALSSQRRTPVSSTWRRPCAATDLFRLVDMEAIRRSTGRPSTASRGGRRSPGRPSKHAHGQSPAADPDVTYRGHKVAHQGRPSRSPGLPHQGRASGVASKPSPSPTPTPSPPPRLRDRRRPSLLSCDAAQLRGSVAALARIGLTPKQARPRHQPRSRHKPRPRHQPYPNYQSCPHCQPRSHCQSRPHYQRRTL